MKKAKFILLTVLACHVLLISTLFMPFSFVAKKANDSYDHVMRDHIKNANAKIVDIKMLGAHDAFTEGITMQSKPNKIEGGIVTNGAVNLFAKGLVVRMTKTQNVSAKQMLYAGVRYFDARVTKVDDKYYASHGYIGKDVMEYIKEITDFLGTHDGEFIIFDLQHFYTADDKNYDLEIEDYLAFFNYINEYKNAKGKSILDYVHIDPRTRSISDITYSEVIGSDAGIIFLAKCDETKYSYFRDKDASFKESRIYYSIRSYWHEENKTAAILKSMQAEYDFIESHNYDDILRVNQAQKTGFFTNAKIIKSLFSWSLLDMGQSFNKTMIKDKDRFMKYLDLMPIYMADYVTSNSGNFNKLANQYIGEANEKL